MKAAFLIGRLLFGGFFLYNGINNLKQHKNLSQYAGLKNVPMPEQAVTAATVLLLLGGGSILLGAKPKSRHGSGDRVFGGGVAKDARFLDPKRSQPAAERDDSVQQEYGAAGRGYCADGGRRALASERATAEVVWGNANAPPTRT
jgi:hypothetical protein